MSRDGARAAPTATLRHSDTPLDRLKSWRTNLDSVIAGEPTQVTRAPWRLVAILITQAVRVPGDVRAGYRPP